jgi:hypothetical protein
MTKETKMTKKGEVDPKVKRELEVDAVHALEEVTGLIINTDEEWERFGGYLRDVLYPMEAKAEGMFEAIILKQKVALAAQKEALAETQSELGKLLQPILSAKGVIRAAMGAFVARKKEAQRVLQERVRADAERRRAEGAPPPAPVPAAPPREMAVEGVSTRENWKAEVVDPGRVAPAFMVPDKTKISKTVRAMGKDAQAVVGEGVRIWCEEVVSVRS